MDGLTWFGKFLLVWWPLWAVVTVLQIGRPRTAFTHLTAVLTLFVSGVFVYSLLTVGTGSLS